MNAFRTPGVTIVERSTLPGAIAPVATAIPAFIGVTETGSAADPPVRITSILEYEELFGGSQVQPISLDVTRRQTEDGAPLGIDVALATPLPDIPPYMLHYCMKLYFGNGGGPCWIKSIGNFVDPPVVATLNDFTNGITAIEAVDEPTLLVFPDAVRMGVGNTEGVIQAALASCLRMQDRFTIADVPEAMPGGGNADTSAIDAGFRTTLSPVDPKALEMGAAYWPYLNTRLNWFTQEAGITIDASRTLEFPNDGGLPTAIDDVAPAGDDPIVPNSTAISEDAIRLNETAIYAAAKAFVSSLTVTLPPSAAIAGAYATTDRNRGVHKSPANIGLALVQSPAVQATNAMNDLFNVDTTSGKSINVIRTFSGRGIKVWGARTLSGNSMDWRYISVRRLFIFMEESIKQATEHFIFEANGSNTWMRIRTMVEGFLDGLWRDGALQGEKPEHAYEVRIGLGVTMTPLDILQGILRFTVSVAPTRPAEFIEITFTQKLQQS